MKTHQERSEEAAATVRRAVETTDGGLSVRLAPGDWVTPGGAVARLTYPTELVKAARELLETIDSYAVASFGESEDNLRATLALYDPRGEPGKETP